MTDFTVGIGTKKLFASKQGIRIYHHSFPEIKGSQIWNGDVAQKGS